jgi:hypothetical protein
LTEIISTDEDPGLRIESFAIVKLRGINYKLSFINKGTVIAAEEKMLQSQKFF